MPDSVQAFLSEQPIPVSVILLRLGLACLFVLPLGLDREIRAKTAGLRSYLLASLGACLFALLTMVMVMDRDVSLATGGNPFSVIKAVAEAAAVLAAGTMIARRDGGLYGVTTGIGLWLSTGVGLATGFGAYLAAGLAALFGAIIISLVGYLEVRWINNGDREPG